MNETVKILLKMAEYVDDITSAKECFIKAFCK